MEPWVSPWIEARRNEEESQAGVDPGAKGRSSSSRRELWPVLLKGQGHVG